MINNYQDLIKQGKFQQGNLNPEHVLIICISIFDILLRILQYTHDVYHDRKYLHIIKKGHKRELCYKDMYIIKKGHKRELCYKDMYIIKRDTKGSSATRTCTS
jgi:hypothetical protein